jgi:crotonobetainyl-CoA:carnitine CoA-transferase CaiB-like acyl-CoA transferase
MKKSLGNIRVLDLSRVLAGPYCTQILGDLGADIIKIEKPGSGDDTRLWGPPFLKDKNGVDSTESAYYLSANRNKKSLAVDISTKDGQALIHKLLEQSDVLIENFKTGGLHKYGLSYAQLKVKYPRLVYCSITGFGQTGPMAHEPGYDFIAQGMGGLMASTGEPQGTPMKAGVALSDIMTGLNAAIGILAALRHRDETGQGQHVDVALLDCTVSAMSNLAQYYLTADKPAARFGNAHSTIVPYQTFKTQDGHMIVAVGNNKQFVHFAEVLGHAEWAQDPRFAKNQERVVNREALIPLIEKIVSQKPTQHWLDTLHKVGVPCGPVNTMDQVFAMNQIQAREMQITMDHAISAQPIKLVGSPIKLSATPASYEHAPPVLGQHTQDILKNKLGLQEAEIERLEKAGIIQRYKP